MLSSKKIYLERDFASGVYLSEAQSPVPPHALYTCIQKYTVLIHAEEGGVLNQREGERGNRGEYRSQWVENTNMTKCAQEICYP
jgi:hypothetical protein